MRDDKEKLEKIIESLDRIKQYTKDGEDKFFNDYLIQDGVVRNFQVVGDAIKDLSDDLKQKNPDVEWKEAARFRDKVTHHYLDVDFSKVWNAVQNDVEPLRAKVYDIHQRLIYRVPGQREQPSKLEQKLQDKDNPRPKPQDVFKIKQPEKKKERDREDDLSF